MAMAMATMAMAMARERERERERERASYAGVPGSRKAARQATENGVGADEGGRGGSGRVGWLGSEEGRGRRARGSCRQASWPAKPRGELRTGAAPSASAGEPARSPSVATRAAALPSPDGTLASKQDRLRPALDGVVVTRAALALLGASADASAAAASDDALVGAGCLAAASAARPQHAQQKYRSRGILLGSRGILLGSLGILWCHSKAAWPPLRGARRGRACLPNFRYRG